MSLSCFSKACLVGFLLLAGCKATPPSEAISNSVVNGLHSHVEAISLLEKQTTPECKTDAFVANLNALKAQTENMVGQVKNISQSCKIEKQEILSRIYTRDCIIIIFLILFIISVYFHFKK